METEASIKLAEELMEADYYRSSHSKELIIMGYLPGQPMTSVSEPSTVIPEPLAQEATATA